MAGYALYVDTKGDDVAPGSKIAPFATPERARDAIRQIKTDSGLPKGGVDVVLGGGVHHLQNTLMFTAQDSGSADTPVCYRGEDGAKVVLSGGRTVTGFGSHIGQILKADVSMLAISSLTSQHTDPVQITELFYDGKRMDLARWPNHDKEEKFDGQWAYIAGIPEEDTYTQFHYAGNTPSSWKNMDGAQVHIFPNYDWADQYMGIESIDPKRRLITLKAKTRYDLKPGRRFYIRNVFEALDAPGEWYFDRESETLYFWPPEKIADSAAKDVEVTLSFLDHIVALDNAEYITLKGFSFEHSRSHAITITGGNNCSVERSLIQNTGGYAAQIEGGFAHSISGCDMTETGGGGVILAGGERKGLTSGNNSVHNCHIHHYARLIKCYNAAVNISGVGNTITHNLIHDAPHNAILLHGNDHLIEFNEIHNVVSEVQDAGAFYLGRDWSERGNVIRYNAFHDLYGYGLTSEDISEKGTVTYESPSNTWAVYLDDCASGTHIYGNLFFRCALAGVMVGGGKDNILENNVFVESYPAVHMDARWDQFFFPDKQKGVMTSMTEKLKSMNYKEAPFSQRYPNIITALDNPRLPQRNRIVRNVVAYMRDDIKGMSTAVKEENSAIPWHLIDIDMASTVIDSNLVWHYGTQVRVFKSSFLSDDGAHYGWQEWQELGFDGRSFIADPMFVDAENDDFSLKDESPAFKLGFEAIPVEKIGLYEDSARITWPVDKQLKKGEVQQKKWTYEVENKWAYGSTTNSTSVSTN